MRGRAALAAPRVRPTLRPGRRRGRADRPAASAPAASCCEWRDHPRPWTAARPASTATRRSTTCSTRIGTFARAQRAADQSRATCCSATPSRCARAWAEIAAAPRRAASTTTTAGKRALCELAGTARDLRNGQQHAAVSTARTCRARRSSRRATCSSTRWSRFRDRADADLAALVHDGAAGVHRQLRGSASSAPARVDFLDLLIRARDLVRDDAPGARRVPARASATCWSTSSRTPIRCRPSCCCDARRRRVAAAAAGDPLDLPVRPGALFIVGDPKQSIYRFRRADVGVYRAHLRAADRRAAPARVRLRTSFRSVPAIQRAVNAAFSAHMTGDAASLQADYVELQPSRDDHPAQPAVVALPVPRPLSERGNVTQAALAASLPEAVGEFVRWLVRTAAARVPDERSATGQRPTGGAAPADPRRRRLPAVPPVPRLPDRRDPRLRRGAGVARPAAPAGRRQGVSRARGGRRAAHGAHGHRVARRRRCACSPRCAARSSRSPRRSCWPGTRSATASGRSTCPRRCRRSSPPWPRRWACCASCNRQRNHRPVAETIGRLIEITRAHAGFVLWRGGEQVLANVLQIAELARQYEADGGLSFRGFVDELRDAADRAPTPEAPILEEGTDGVRLMTVHKAKGLEFPVVILADIGCKLQSRRRAAPSRRGARPGGDHAWPAGRRSTCASTTRSRRRAIAPRACGSPTSRPRAPAICWSFRRSATGRTTRAGSRRCRRRSTAATRCRRAGRAGVPRPRHRARSPAEQRRDAAHHAAGRLRPRRSGDRRRLHRGVVGSAAARPAGRRAPRPAPRAPDRQGCASRRRRRRSRRLRRWRAVAQRHRSAAASRPSLRVMTATRVGARHDGRRRRTLPAAIAAIAAHRASGRRRRVRSVPADRRAFRHPGPRPAGARAARRHHWSRSRTWPRCRRGCCGPATPSAPPRRRWSIVRCAMRCSARARTAQAAGRTCRREVSLGVVVDGVVVDGQADLLFDDGDALAGRGLQDRRRDHRQRGRLPAAGGALRRRRAARDRGPGGRRAAQGVRGGSAMLDSMRNDIRHVARMLGRSPGVTAAAVLTLGFGIGADHGDLQRRQQRAPQPAAVPRPGPRSSAIVHAIGGVDQPYFSDAIYLAYADTTQAFEDLGVWVPGETATITGQGDPRTGALADGEPGRPVHARRGAGDRAVVLRRRGRAGRAGRRDARPRLLAAAVRRRPGRDRARAHRRRPPAAESSA